MKKEISRKIPSFKIFDFHCHPIKNLKEFQENIEKFNIDSFCLMPSMIEHDFYSLKSYKSKINPYLEKYPDKTKVFGYLDFSKNGRENELFLKRQKEAMNISGIKIHPAQTFDLRKQFLKPYFKAISKIFGYQIPIYIHMDWPLTEDNGYAPLGKKETFNKFPKYFPEYNFIMGHAGGSGDYLRIWKTCKKYSNVYIETSMAPVPSTLSEVVWKVGANRLVFGSNFPYCRTIVEIQKILNLYKVSEEIKKKIFESNWRELIT